MKKIAIISLIAAATISHGTAQECLAFNGPERLDINLQTSHPELAATSKDLKMVPGFSHQLHATQFLISNSTYATRTYHDTFTCTACHGAVENEAAVDSAAAKTAFTKAVKKAGGIKKYMHATCLGCHKNMKKANHATGPTSCKGCHGAK